MLTICNRNRVLRAAARYGICCKGKEVFRINKGKALYFSEIRALQNKITRFMQHTPRFRR